jgi:hypothetical protein
MSHSVKINVVMDDLDVVAEVAQKLGYQFERQSKSYSFYDQTHVGPAVVLPGWQFPVVLTTEGVMYDNYTAGRGSMPTTPLQSLQQEYATTKARKDLALSGLSSTIGSVTVDAQGCMVTEILVEV